MSFFGPKSNENIVMISSLKYLVAPWKFFGLSGDLVSNIINKEAYKKPQKASRKPQESYKNFQGRNPYNIFVAILVEMMTPKSHFINKEACRSQKKLPRSTKEALKTFRAEILTIFSLLFWSKQ